jgi:hypothetical protein
LGTKVSFWNNFIVIQVFTHAFVQTVADIEACLLPKDLFLGCIFKLIHKEQQQQVSFLTVVGGGESS